MCFVTFLTKSYPLVYCHAPASLNGLALPHPYVEQGIAHIGLVLTHGAIDTPTGSLLRASLEQAQLEVGIGTSFLSEPFAMYGFLLTDCLWKTIWSFISEHRISLAFGDQVLPKRQRQGDEFIMQLLIQQDTLSCTDLISCNCCCLTIEAVTLADMLLRETVNASTTTILALTHPLLIGANGNFPWKNLPQRMSSVGGEVWSF